MDMMFAPLKKYADFQGRARRQEYWMFFLFTFIVNVVLQMLARMLSSSSSPGVPTGLGLIFFILLCLFALAVFIPSLAVAFRRLHDTDRSAWWLLIALVPFLGAIALLVFYCLDGTPGPNKFGPDPKGRGAASTVDTFS